MNKNGLSITLIFKAQSLNYGEGIGNISELKKLTRGDGSVYTFASRQALRYDIARIGNKLFDWNLEVVDKSKGTVQFKDELTIEDSEEMDLFGYMKTAKKEEGSSYKSDMDFLNNKGLADRIGEFPNLANIEQHLSFYTYTITIDLEKVGVDGNIKLSNDIRAKRVRELLEIIKILNRDIRGREENLSPLFVIGGIYDLYGKDKEFSINTNILKDTLNVKIGENSIYDDTSIGIIKDTFKNEEKIEELFKDKVSDVEAFFEHLETQVEKYYQT